MFDLEQKLKSAALPMHHHLLSDHTGAKGDSIMALTPTLHHLDENRFFNITFHLHCRAAKLI